MSKLVETGEYTIYVRKAIRKRLDKEKRKTKLINELLERHYQSETVQTR